RYVLRHARELVWRSRGIAEAGGQAMRELVVDGVLAEEEHQSMVDGCADDDVAVARQRRQRLHHWRIAGGARCEELVHPFRTQHATKMVFPDVLQAAALGERMRDQLCRGFGDQRLSA